MLDDNTRTWLLEVLKALATIAVPYIALLKTRAEFDRYAAAQRAKELGTTIESQMRRRWYQRFYNGKRKPPRNPL